MCICSLRCPACNAHAPYCHLWPDPLYNIFPYYLINGTIFGTKKVLNTKCVFWFSLLHLSTTFLILRRNERDMIKNVWWSSCEVPFILLRFEWKLKFSTNFRKILECQISWKSVQWEPSSIRADRQTDMTKLIVAFRNLASSPNKLPVSNYTADYSSTVDYPNTRVLCQAHIPSIFPHLCTGKSSWPHLMAFSFSFLLHKPLVLHPNCAPEKVDVYYKHDHSKQLTK